MATRRTNPNIYRENNAPSYKTSQPTRLTPQQLEERKEKGLCFNCDSKYSKGHKCGEKKLFYIDCEEEEEEEQEPSQDENVEAISSEELTPTISCNAISSKGKSVIMVIVYRLTKYAHFCALSHTFKASTVATAFMETVQKIHGSPKIIVSDRDPKFTGHFCTELFSCLGTQLALSSSYHPQSNGKTEIVNKCLEGYLRCIVSDKQT